MARARKLQTMQPALIDTIEAIARTLVAERVRQIANLGYDAAHDDAHRAGELARAAAVYAALDLPGEFPPGYIDLLMELWPFPGDEPTTKGSRENLVRAGALILAEIDRIDREYAVQG